MKDFPAGIITFLSTLPHRDLDNQNVTVLRLYGAGHILHGIKVARMNAVEYKNFRMNALCDLHS